MAEQEKAMSNNIPRDLLQRFISDVGRFPVKLEAAEGREDGGVVAEELELTLGLSSNGRFGVDPMRTKKIKRTSSIPEFVMAKAARDEDDASCNAMRTAVMRSTTTTPLMRSCSLPTETEEEWRKRKEMQTLRRMEARRKRSEKQRISKAAAATATVKERNRASSEDNNGEEVGGGGVNENTSLRKTTSLTRDCLGGLNLNSGLPPTPSSQGIGSSAISESESQPPPQGGGGERRRRNALEEMPCVSTKGEGPNGKRIQGFLYGYKKKGEEVRIVCVCHGSFLTPAEFVKHAGGHDVAHPLKHILVTPSFF